MLHVTTFEDSLSPWDSNASGSIYSWWDRLDESFMMQSKANAHDHRFLRYKWFGVLWLLIGWSLGGFLRCRGLPSIIEKVFLRAFQCNLDRQKRPIIRGDMSEWSLWQRERIATCRLESFNENLTSSPSIHSSYLYRVATRSSHVSIRTILCTSSHILSYTCQVSQKSDYWMRTESMTKYLFKELHK